jgi:hypothetical protein
MMSQMPGGSAVAAMVEEERVLLGAAHYARRDSRM